MADEQVTDGAQNTSQESNKTDVVSNSSEQKQVDTGAQNTNKDTNNTAATTTTTESTDWRTKYAAGDEAKLNTLKRYPSEKEFSEAFFHGRAELQKLMSNQPPGKDATPEQIKAYRTAQGVPDAPEKYLDALPKDMVFGEADKPGIMNYLKAAHERGEKPDSVLQNLQIYKQAQDSAIQAMHDNDAKAKQNLEATLSKEWGGDFKANIDIFNNFMSAQFPKEIEGFLMNARGADGSPLMLNVPFVKAMVNMARMTNPMNLNTGGMGADQVGSIDDQIAVYEKRIRTEGKEWYRDDKSQKHYQELLRARERYTGSMKKQG